MGRRTFIGLDLGQATDYTALAVVQRTEAGVLELRELDRVRGRRYPDVVKDVAALLARVGGAALAVDMTGVGRPVVDMLRLAVPASCQLLGVTVTAGSTVTAGDPGCVNVPKKTLVCSAQLALQGQRLKVARELELADALVRELTAFKVRITSHAHEVFGADWREGEHDDLVFALCLAVWLAENQAEPYDGPLVHWPPAPTPTQSKPLAEWTQADVLHDLGYTDDDYEPSRAPWRP